MEQEEIRSATKNEQAFAVMNISEQCGAQKKSFAVGRFFGEKFPFGE